MTALRRVFRPRGGLVLGLLLLLAACGSPEEKQARYLARGLGYVEQGDDSKAMIEFKNVLRLNPKHAETRYQVGLLHERAQRWPQAFASFQEATNENPQMIKAQAKLGTLALLGNELPIATRAAEAIDKTEPGNADGLALQAAIALRQGETQQALDLAKAAVAKDPDHENGLAVYVGVLQRLGEGPRAIGVLDEAIARKPQTAALRLLKVSLIEQAGDLGKIRQAYDELIAFDPKNESYRLRLASTLASRQDQEGAEAVLRQSVEGDFGSARSVAFLAQLIRRTQGPEAAEAELRRQVEREPDDWALRFLLAESLVQAKQLDPAAAELQVIVDKAGEGATQQDANAALAQVALLKGDLPRARTTADLVIGQNGEHRGANLVRAVVALRESQLDEALRNARTALRRDPNWLPALKLVAEVHYRRGEQDLAVGTLNEIMALDPKDAQAAQVLAGLLTQRGDFDAALKVWDGVLERTPSAGQALQSRAQIAIQQKNWTAAQADIDTLIAQPGQEAAGALLAGNLLVAQNRPDEGREWFEKAQTAAPDAPEPVIGVVRTYLAKNDVDQAVAFLRQHTEAKPDDAVAFNMLGELAVRRKDLAGAREAYARAWTLQPTWPTPRRQLGLALARDGQTDAAVQVFQEATTAIPNNAEVLNDLASMFLLAQRPAEAIPVYEKVLVLQPGSEVAINNMAALVADHRYQDPAALQKALELAGRFRSSNNPYFLDTLGWLYYRKGEHAVAATYLDRAVSQAGDRPDLRAHLGLALAGSGQTERAVTELRRATAADVQPYQGIEDAKATLAKLEAQQQAPRPAAGTTTPG